MNELMSVAQAVELIRSGAPLSLAGPEQVLDQMPRGNWIGGTSSYFMTPDGGTVVTEGQVFVTRLAGMGDVSVACYGPEELAGIAGNAPSNGFSLTIIPAGGKAHQRFAAEAADYPEAFLKPTVGWIAGVHLAELGRATPKVYDGRSATKHEDRAVVTYVAVPDPKLVSIEIVNLFEPEQGDVLRFFESSFNVRECEVNGERTSFADYVRRRGLDGGKLPLVGDFAGARLNASLQSVQGDTVALYAPVFPGVDYHFATPVSDYAGAFRARLSGMEGADAALGCNCILNFLFGELEGKAIGGVAGPITFGEIAYQLLNQTMVIVKIVE